MGPLLKWMGIRVERRGAIDDGQRTDMQLVEGEAKRVRPRYLGAERPRREKGKSAVMAMVWLLCGGRPCRRQHTCLERNSTIWTIFMEWIAPKHRRGQGKMRQ